MKNITISKRIGLCVAVPLFGLAIVSANHITESYNEYQRYVFMHEIAGTVNDLTALTHNMQVERGLSAGFAGSGAKTVPQNVIDARAATDAEINKLKNDLDIVAIDDHPKLAEYVKNLLNQLNDVKNFRLKVDNQGSSVGSVLGYYSNIIASMFDVSYKASKLAVDSNVALEIASMLSLSTTKELAGKERGLTNGLLGLGSITPDQMTRLQTLVTPQAVMSEKFLSQVPYTNKITYENMLAETNLAAVNALRNKIMANADDLSAAGVTQKEWFTTATSRIVKLRELEKFVGQNVIKAVEEAVSTTRNAIILKSIISAFIFILALIGGLFISRSITSPMLKLQGDMKRLSDGEIDFRVEGAKRKTELGYMALALESFQESERDKRKMEEDARIEQEAHEAAKAKIAEQQAQQEKEYRQAVQILGAGLERFSVGNFEQPIEEEFPEALDDLRGFYNETLAKLAGTLAKVRATGSSLLNDANGLKETSQELSQRTEEQAASLEQTAAALQQVTDNVRASADRSEEADKIIQNANRNSENSSSVVGKTIDAMSQIEKTSGEISQIISVIDDIAFQTNLLALNAGVEAARAGEAGKGFAVVAQEVRELAQRSASAAKEIEELIRSSGQEVENGVKLVKEAGEVLSAITDDVASIKDYISSVSRSASEQSAGLDQINQAISTIDGVTQDNANMVVEADEITKRVAGGSHLLHSLMADFKTRKVAAPRNVQNRGLLVASEIEQLKEAPLPEASVAQI